MVLAAVYVLPAAQFAVLASLVQTLLPILGDEDHAYSAGLIGLAIGVGGATRFVSALVTGQISDRISRRAALIPGLLAQLTGALVLATTRGSVGWWTSILLLSLGSTAVNVGSTILADLSEGRALGRRLGAFRFSGDVGFLVAPLLTGALYDLWGAAAATIPVVTMATVALVGAVFVIPETRS